MKQCKSKFDVESTSGQPGEVTRRPREAEALNPALKHLLFFYLPSCTNPRVNSLSNDWIFTNERWILQLSYTRIFHQYVLWVRSCRVLMKYGDRFPVGYWTGITRTISRRLLNALMKSHVCSNYLFSALCMYVVVDTYFSSFWGAMLCLELSW